MTLVWANIFLDLTPKTKAAKGKIKWVVQMKKPLYIKGNHHMKRQPTEWEKIFANNISCKGLISKIYKEPMELKQKHKEPDLKMGKVSLFILMMVSLAM